EHPPHGGGHYVRLGRRHEEGIAAGVEEVRKTTDVRTHHREPAGHRLQHAHGGVVHVRRVDEHVAALEPVRHLVVRHAAGEVDSIEDTETSGRLSRPGEAAVLVWPDHHEAEVREVRPEAGHYLGCQLGVVDPVEGPEPDEPGGGALAEAEWVGCQIHRVRHEAHAL